MKNLITPEDFFQKKNLQLFENNPEAIKNNWRIGYIDFLNINNGYFGLKKNNSLFYPDYEHLGAFSFLGDGYSEFAVPGGSINYNIPNGHLGIYYYPMNQPQNKPTSHNQVRVIFWLKTKIQNYADSIRILEHNRFTLAYFDYCQVKIGSYKYSGDYPTNHILFLDKKISEKSFDKTFQIPPE
jgi:hypothetical protein